MIGASLEAGLRAIQLRERDLATSSLIALAEETLCLTRKAGAKLFINDRVDLAMSLGADGVHLRGSSLPVCTVRRIMGPSCLIGVSVHSVEEATRVEADGADFVVLGPIYETPSKRSYGLPLGLKPLEKVARSTRIPIFAIGGITPTRAREVCAAGAFGVAVISSILEAESPAQATREYLNALASAR
jgi:thiamine-phosphate pyrophosphorylase